MPRALLSHTLGFVAVLSLAACSSSSSGGSGNSPGSTPEGAGGTTGAAGQTGSSCPTVSTTDGTTACNSTTCTAGNYCAGVNCLVGCENTSQCAAGQYCDLSNPQMSFNGKPLGTCRVPNCGGPQGSGGTGTITGGGGPMNATSCLTGMSAGASPACQNYVACVETACDSQFKACFGDQYASGTVGGPCATFLQCADNCGCQSSCINSSCPPTQQCSSCLQMAVGCIQNACPTEKQNCEGTTTGGGPGGSSGGTGATCSDLAACCAQMTDMNLAMNCQMEVAQGNDQLCSAALQSYKSGSYCQLRGPIGPRWHNARSVLLVNFPAKRIGPGLA